jgi:RNA polymerase sigma-70 factor, ECF subfamily
MERGLNAMDSQPGRPVQKVNGFAEITDYELVRLCQRGHNQAFAELVRRHQSSSLKFAVSILRDRQDAEDEVQNAFWKAFDHINQFQQDAKFSTWLTRIVVNQCLMRLRQTRRAKFLYLDDSIVGEETMAFDLPDRGPTPEDQLGRAEVGAVLKHEIRRIPPLLRTVFMLRDVEHLPMTDVAERLGISVAAAKSRLLRARLELRARMEKHAGRVGPAALLA